jgi:hypothetical protein
MYGVLSYIPSRHDAYALKKVLTLRNKSTATTAAAVIVGNNRLSF